MSLSMSQITPPDKDGDARTKQEQEDESTGEMDITIEATSFGSVTGTKKHRNSGSKPPYQAFLGQLYALIEGAIDGNRYEDSCRQLLGNKSYTLFGLDKIIQQTLKCLQAMTNDESVNKLIGLFVYHKSKGRIATQYSLSSNGTANAPSSSFSTSIPTSTSTSTSNTSTEGIAMDVDSSSQKEEESSAMNISDSNDNISINNHSNSNNNTNDNSSSYDDSNNNKNNNNNENNNNNNNNNNNSNNHINSNINSKGVNSVDLISYQFHVSKVLQSFSEDIYRIQLLTLGSFESDSEYQHVACQCLGVLGPGGVPVYSPPTIASLALSTTAAASAASAVAVQGNGLSLSLPPCVTTFASISNVTATVYDIAGIINADDLSTSALEDALLPPQPPSSSSSTFPLSLPLSLSSSLPNSSSQVAINNENIIIDLKDRERDEKDVDGSYSRGNGQAYWNIANNEHTQENLHYNGIKNEIGNGISTSQKHENNEMNIKEENYAFDSVNIKSERAEVYGYIPEGEVIARHESERETDLNMNGEAVSIAEKDKEEEDDGDRNDGIVMGRIDVKRDETL